MFLPIDAEVYVSERRDRLLREAEEHRLARRVAPRSSLALALVRAARVVMSRIQAIRWFAMDRV